MKNDDKVVCMGTSSAALPLAIHEKSPLHVQYAHAKGISMERSERFHLVVLLKVIRLYPNSETKSQLVNFPVVACYFLFPQDK